MAAAGLSPGGRSSLSRGIILPLLVGDRAMRGQYSDSLTSAGLPMSIACQGSLLSPAEQTAIVEGHQAFAVWVVRRFYPQLRGDDFDDAVGAANIGLVIAAQRFNPSLGFTFRTFAEDHCRRLVSRQRVLDRQHGMRPISINSPRHASIDAAREDAEGGIAALFVADPELDPDAALDVEAMLAVLPDRWREVLVAVEGLDESTTDVAARLGISRTRVGQLRRKAIERIRETFDVI